MRKRWRFWVGLSLVFSVLSVAACQNKGQTSSEEAAPVEERAASGKADTEEEKNSNPKTYKNVKKETQLFWATGVEPVQYEMSGTVEGTTETYVRELTDPKYQGRSGGSEGNRAAADWLAEQFQMTGLQQLPGLGSWKQSYETAVTSILSGEAFLIAPDGTEKELKLGEDWAFQASPEQVDKTLSLSTDHTLYEEGKAIWDAKAEPKDGSEKLCLTTGEVSEGILYTNALGVPSRITVTDAVYEQLKQEGYQIYLRLPDGIEEQGTADNVVGYLPGKDHTKAVVLGANFDGAGQCGPLLMPGAYNNVSGVATLLQTARWLAASDELPCDVIFAAFNTEDNREKGSEALSEYMETRYEQIRMINLKCLGWKDQPLTVYGADSEADLRKSLAGGLGVQYADMDVGGDEAAFREENMSSVVLIQDACLNKQEVSAVLHSVHDVPENLDFAMLDETAKKLAAWVIERGDEPLASYVVYW